MSLTVVAGPNTVVLVTAPCRRPAAAAWSPPQFLNLKPTKNRRPHWSYVKG
ncbi:MAG: hypothetical protein JWO52_126 [Gammaproteobacteria bacterium]|nr:hypothetical protein [Gammaproteobacteria bacterium]